MEIVEKIMTNSPCYRANQKITPKGLVLHSVGINQPSAEVFIRLYSTRNDVSMHGFIDANTGVIYETLPQDINGWHVGGSANKTHLGFEMCEPAEIKYTKGDKFTVTNIIKAQESAKRTYDAAVEYFAFLCKKYGFDPLKKGVIISHNEARLSGVGSAHTDPEHLWNGLNLPYTMDGFRLDVKQKMTAEEEPEENDGNIYLVQVGAFKSKQNAENYAKLVTSKGFNAVVTVKGDYDGDGKITSADARDILRKSVGLDE